MLYEYGATPITKINLDVVSYALPLCNIILLPQAAQSHINPDPGIIQNTAENSQQELANCVYNLHHKSEIL